MSTASFALLMAAAGLVVVVAVVWLSAAARDARAARAAACRYDHAPKAALPEAQSDARAEAGGAGRSAAGTAAHLTRGLLLLGLAVLVALTAAAVWFWELPHQ